MTTLMTAQHKRRYYRNVLLRDTGASPCAPLVWNQGFPTPLGESSISTNSVKAPDICISSSRFRKKHPRHEEAMSRTVLAVVVCTWPSCINPVTIDGEDLEDVKTITHSGSIIDGHGGSDTDVKARIGKARAAYLQLKNIWNAKQLSTNTKLSTQSTSDPLAKHYQQQRTVGDNKPDPSGGRNQEEALELKKKLGKDAEGRSDIHCKNHQTTSRGKPQLGILKGNVKDED
ncbi:unnamed protein product [Schistosoma curassoni]|uniref:PPM-type phosphatase domain-containing protein n=1 Tax=Schistosoma curassoni TaxID=6186 RepID=A0A183K7K4_9TREM|nr:unnamed protein product [Schistosoma curassoni]